MEVRIALRRVSIQTSESGYKAQTRLATCNSIPCCRSRACLMRSWFPRRRGMPTLPYASRPAVSGGGARGPRSDGLSPRPHASTASGSWLGPNGGRPARQETLFLGWQHCHDDSPARRRSERCREASGNQPAYAAQSAKLDTMGVRRKPYVGIVSIAWRRCADHNTVTLVCVVLPSTCKLWTAETDFSGRDKSHGCAP